MGVRLAELPSVFLLGDEGQNPAALVLLGLLLPEVLMKAVEAQQGWYKLLHSLHRGPIHLRLR